MLCYWRMHQLSIILLAQMYPLQDSFSITRKLSKPTKGKKDSGHATRLYLWCGGFHVKELHFVDVETFALTTELKWLKATKREPRDNVLKLLYPVRFRKDIEWRMHITNLVLVEFDEVFLDLCVGWNSGKDKKLQNSC